jgi:carbonic anhydrase
MNENPGPQEAIQFLKEGNSRFCEDRMEHPCQNSKTREKLTAGQQPIAAILCCADSRVSPELVFDSGLGDLFVIRNAGNVVTSAAIASIEYAVAQLGIKLVMVMGHDQCGAVQAAIDGVELGQLNSITEKILPAVRLAEKMAGDLLDNTIRLNARQMTEILRHTDPIIKPAYDKGELKILPAIYSFGTGRVTFI